MTNDEKRILAARLRREGEEDMLHANLLDAETDRMIKSGELSEDPEGEQLSVSAALAKANLRIDKLSALCTLQQAALAKLGQAVDNHQKILEAQGWGAPAAANPTN
jgi:hypothetical protein